MRSHIIWTYPCRTDLFAALFHFDELNYGKIQRENLNAVVTLGTAGWGYPIRTEKHSEYVVLNIVPEQ